MVRNSKRTFQGVEECTIVNVQKIVLIGGSVIGIRKINYIHRSYQSSMHINVLGIK